ncbi:hypothetical protein [Herbaspirillum sp. SJZ107]|uniref:hypothetical protein n=1 Tax=Herbaspirillum sp. SJZ107 TaxID=2572881 RepID=UPI00116951D1|nr:hypothetical protein [Herbaspirillum sp. SJZ107]TQK05374.1 hypothetical protein FBX97_4348 [Herbaspirillum sp. SJZ107]
MTVAIKRANGLEYRVFAFDPEAQVGSGAGPTAPFGTSPAPDGNAVSTNPAS